MPLTKEDVAEVSQIVADALVEANNAETPAEKKAILAEETKNLPHRQQGGVEKVGKFIAAAVTGNAEVLKDLSEGTSDNGGYMVPTEFESMMIEKRQPLYALRNIVTEIPMGRDKLNIPVEANGITIYWPGENTEITQSDPTVGQVALDVNTYAAISRMSREFLADCATNPAATEWVMQQFAKATAKNDDKMIVVGTGTGQPKGIRQETITQTLAQAGSGLAGDDVINLFYTLPRAYRDHAVFVMPDSIVKLVRKLKDTAGHYLWAENFTQGVLDQNVAATLMGRPVYISDDIPTNLGTGTNESEIWFGDFSYYLWGVRQGMEIETSTQEGTSFAKHQASVKMTGRVDGKTALVGAFANLTGVK